MATTTNKMMILTKIGAKSDLNTNNINIKFKIPVIKATEMFPCLNKTTTPISKANNTSPPNRYPIIDEFCSEKTILKALTTAPSYDE
ncbi:hypothetical protein [Lactococcus lactis]|uniref:hypothetical protein n=1 Tax=Lactococcus lactis TaxID=1358 RepID=UPI00071D77D2|nr:hypothetical protein [Lactococcus lactis]